MTSADTLLPAYAPPFGETSAFTQQPARATNFGVTVDNKLVFDASVAMGLGFTFGAVMALSICLAGYVLLGLAVRAASRAWFTVTRALA